MWPRIMSGCTSCLFILMTSVGVMAGEFHVTADGSPQGDGSRAKPWDLATALGAVEQVQPGDTVWLHAGIYRGGFVSQLAGSSEAPIVVRGVPNERATIDTNPRDGNDNGLLLLDGAHTIYRDFEVTCSHPARVTQIAGSWPDDIRRGSVDIRGDHISAVNLVVHDQASGFGFWSEGEGGEIYGCLIYNNGWRGPDRGHGHGIYAQNARGTKRIVDNILFHQFAYGIHCYGSENASLKGFDIEGNIAFENGCLSPEGANSPGIFVGGGTPAERITIRENVVIGGGARLGYAWGPTNNDVVCAGNYFDQGLNVRDFRSATITQNTIIAESNVAILEGEGQLLLDGLDWNDNDYYVTDGRWGDFAIVESGKSGGLSFDDWRQKTGLDSKSTFSKQPPSKERVFVRANQYEPGRAHIAIINPARAADVNVDLSSVLKIGQKFRVVSAKDFFGPSIVSGEYDGTPIELPLQPIQSPLPVGLKDVKLPVTEPEFSAFIVLPVE